MKRSDRRPQGEAAGCGPVILERVSRIVLEDLPSELAGRVRGVRCPADRLPIANGNESREKLVLHVSGRKPLDRPRRPPRHGPRSAGCDSDRQGGSLPEIVAIEATQATHREPRVYCRSREHREASESVETLVRTVGKLPARDVTLVRFMEYVWPYEYELPGASCHRFFSLEPAELKPGAASALGCPFAAAHRVESRFHYRPGGVA